MRPAQQSSPRGQVFSYYANRNVRSAGARSVADAQQTADKLARPRKQLDWRKQLPVVGALGFILLVTIMGMHLGGTPKVEVVSGKSEVFLRSRETYEAAAQKAFASPFNRNKLTVNTDKIATYLQKQFPELRVVSVTLPVVGSQPVIYIQPAAPKLILVGKGGMYLLDSEGRALITGNQVPDLDSLKIPVVNDQSNLQLSLGKVVLPRDTVSFISQITGQLASKGIKINSMTMPAGATELQVRIDRVGYYVKFNLHGNAREEAGAYLAIKDYLAKNHKTPAEYVDVRVENKAYYK